MSGGLRFTPEQLRALPLLMQEKIGLAIAEQMEKTAMAVEQKNEEMENQS